MARERERQRGQSRADVGHFSVLHLGTTWITLGWWMNQF